MATATMQEQLTQSKIQIEIVSNQAEAELAKARKDAERRVVTAKADSESVALEGRGKSESIEPGRHGRGQSAVAKGRNPSATAGCTPFRWWPTRSRTASSRWFPPRCSVPTADKAAC